MNFEKRLNGFLTSQQFNESKIHKQPTFNYFYVSQVGTCNRMLYFIKKFGYKFDIKITKFYQIGRILHEFIQKNLFDNSMETEIPLTINFKNLIISGRIDCIHKNEIYEFKTASYLPKEPIKKDILQLNMYLSQHKDKTGKLIYISKMNLDSLEFEFKFDQKLYELSLQKFEKVYECLKNNTIPIINEDEHNAEKYPCECLKIYSEEIKKEKGE